MTKRNARKEGKSKQTLSVVNSAKLILNFLPLQNKIKQFLTALRVSFVRRHKVNCRWGGTLHTPAASSHGLLLDILFLFHTDIFAIVAMLTIHRPW